MAFKQPWTGMLRETIVIGDTVNEINENGYPEDTDTIVATVRAAIEDTSSRWIYAADAEAAQRQTRYIIRWRGDVREGMWIEHQGVRRTITGVGACDDVRRYMRLITERVEGVL